VNNLIILKELQVLYGTLRKGDEGLKKKIKNQKDFHGFWVRRGGWGDSTPFERRGFF